MLGIFLDLETNGLDCFKNRVLEIAYKIVDLEKKETIGSYHSRVFQPKEVWDRSDPNSLKVNGLKGTEQEGLSEKTVKDAIIEQFFEKKIHRENAVFICQNPSFDRPFFAQLIDANTQESLKWPYHWLDLASMFFAVHEFCPSRVLSPQPFLPLSKNKIGTSLGLAEEAFPHTATNGAEHLWQCYEALFERKGKFF